MQPKHFEAALEKGHYALGWTIAHLPFDPRKEWKQMIKLRVSGEINGFPFRTSLFAGPANSLPGNTSFYLLVTRAMLKGAALEHFSCRCRPASGCECGFSCKKSHVERILATA